MAKHDKMLPQCQEREANTTALLVTMDAKIDKIAKAVVGNGSTQDSILAIVSRHIAYWRLFAILASIIGLAFTVGGIIYAATR